MDLEPSDNIPEFLVERFHELPAEELRAVAEYVQSDEFFTSSDVPDDLTTSFELQDDQTMEAIGEHVEKLAVYSEEHGGQPIEEITDESEEDEEDDDAHRWHGF
ncbi:hypothetical protein [Halostella sp. PRR32]|uniref:hypothetical protein n=1 Tax=Halostella sp. PRR32 TaxID=3098147 RepID=UPI002B1E2C09|nr:hypothetical protein [Halostella sp. PRR32]